MRPIRQRLGADADAVKVGQILGQQRLDVAAQDRRLHHHRVAAGDQHAADLRVLADVTRQLLGLLAGELQVGIADELRPTKTVATIGVAGLALRREKQHGLLILVLHTGNHFAVELGHVQLHLPGRVRVEFAANLIGGELDLRLGCIAHHEVAHALVIRLLQHAALRKGELKNRVVRDVAGIDQVLDHVIIHAERQHGRYRLHVEDLLLVEFQLLRDLRKILSGARLEFRHILSVFWLFPPAATLRGAPSHAAWPVAHPAGQRFSTHPVRSVTITQSRLMKSLSFSGVF